MQDLDIFHGSSKIIVKPEFGYGKFYNDYGMAFYCTEKLEMAEEWACTESEDGFANQYRLHGTGLRELNLCSGEYHILNWLAILLENRVFRMDSDLQEKAKQYILEQFLPDYRGYDVIRGYRADDSYFSFAGAFLNNALTLEQLNRAMHFGDLGEQIAVRSRLAFEQLEFIGAEPAVREIYYPKKANRDQMARQLFRKEKTNVCQGTYMIDLMREQWRDDDERLQRIIHE